MRKYRVILINDSSKSKCLWNKYYLGHLHKSHIKWKGKVSIFNGGHYLSLIMNTNVLFTLQTKWRLQHRNSVHKTPFVLLCWSRHFVCKVNKKMVFMIRYNWYTPLKTWNVYLSFDMWFMKVPQTVLIR